VIILILSSAILVMINGIKTTYKMCLQISEPIDPANCFKIHMKLELKLKIMDSRW